MTLVAIHEVVRFATAADGAHPRQGSRDVELIRYVLDRADDVEEPTVRIIDQTRTRCYKHCAGVVKIRHVLDSVGPAPVGTQPQTLSSIRNVCLTPST